MLCSDCDRLPPRVERITRRMDGFQGPPGWERIRLLFCSRCGAPVPLGDANSWMLERLCRLARFGLAAGGRPVIWPAHATREDE